MYKLRTSADGESVARMAGVLHRLWHFDSVERIVYKLGTQNRLNKVTQYNNLNIK